ncbi:MAG: DUF4091 domain-containing protein [Treponema sp.]|jgi:hypothetical protein|nr:DUF4091 domain-containing protein [Treponema sp.]
MHKYDFYLADSLEKVFPLKRPRPIKEKTIPVLEGITPAVQLVYIREKGEKPAPFVTPFNIIVEGSPVAPVFRSVELTPAEYPCHETTDSAYLSTEPGLFPDLLCPMETNAIKPMTDQYRSIWIDFPGITNAMTGLHKVTIKIEAQNEVVFPNGRKAVDPEASGVKKELCLYLDVKPYTLPQQTLLQTQWFHTDCLSSYYKVEVFSEDHWRIIEAFMEPMLKRYGINCMLTPVFTPPLDTEPGGERPTVQLVDIEKNGSAYSFCFDRLVRWCGLCKKHSITHIEIPHFFTQWGAEYTPKITARNKDDGKISNIFGWDVSARSNDYQNFLEQFIPTLRKVLADNGYNKDHVIFHVSDEPNINQKENYLKAKETIAKLVEGSLLVDALSDIAFYKEGIVTHPIPPVNHAAPFIEEGIPDLWVYYCTGQYYKVPNRFFAMPSSRTRAMGILMYYFNIKGFLQWGYNFYYSQNSRKLINPFLEASGCLAWPAGDPFLVYPGEDGKPLSSIRGEVHREGFEDIRLLCLLEEKIGRESVLALIHEDFPDKIHFEHYPLEPEYYFRLREKAVGLLS